MMRPCLMCIRVVVLPCIHLMSRESTAHSGVLSASITTTNTTKSQESLASIQSSSVAGGGGVRPKNFPVEQTDRKTHPHHQRKESRAAQGNQTPASLRVTSRDLHPQAAFPSSNEPLSLCLGVSIDDMPRRRRRRCTDRPEVGCKSSSLLWLFPPFFFANVTRYLWLDRER
jgi:hypothetical protein